MRAPKPGPSLCIEGVDALVGGRDLYRQAVSDGHKVRQRDVLGAALDDRAQATEVEDDGLGADLSLGATGFYPIRAEWTCTARTGGPYYLGALNATGRSFVNKTGYTQFRVSFSSDDNDDTGNDYIGWYSGENSTSANRPALEVTYTLP